MVCSPYASRGNLTVLAKEHPGRHCPIVGMSGSFHAPLYIVQAHATGLGRRDARAIQIDLLRRLPVCDAQANHIAFVYDDID